MIYGEQFYASELEMLVAYLAGAEMTEQAAA